MCLRYGRYGQLIGCSSFNADNTTDFYARYSTSFLCNGMVQNSINPCGLTGDATRPLCAESCTEFASSEQEITASNICGNAGSNALKQIRADFTDCALPADSLTGSCINAVQNQPDNCGYTSNLSGLCGYCAASSPNNTDSCCVFSNASSRCNDVTLPIVASSALKPIVMTTTRSSSGSGSTSGAGSGAGLTSNAHRGLTGGQIAGIVVGSVLGALLLLGLIIGACLLFRRRSDRSPATSVFNQPSTSRQPQMAYNDGARDQERAGLAVMPGGRVARMAALEDSSSPEPGPKYAAGGAKYDDDNDSADMAYAAGIAPPPKRSGSLSSGSQLAAAGMMDTSPSTNAEDTSPDSHAQSEQLHFFKDYYSQDEIRPGDLVSTLWAYEPRAADEFHLERGDMIKVLGIWDDGWATGVRIHQKAEDWREDGKIQRDSGLSNGSSRPPDTADGGEVKAFPLVCVCLPQHWRRTIEGETTESSDMQRYPDMP